MQCPYLMWSAGNGTAVVTADPNSFMLLSYSLNGAAATTLRVPLVRLEAHMHARVCFVSVTFDTRQVTACVVGRAQHACRVLSGGGRGLVMG
jgi:hypothetical protein